MILALHCCFLALSAGSNGDNSHGGTDNSNGGTEVVVVKGEADETSLTCAFISGCHESHKMWKDIMAIVTGFELLDE